MNDYHFTKRVAVITHQWLPSSGAGVWRALKFAKYLPRHGWTPTVLTRRTQEVHASIDDTAEDTGWDVRRVDPWGDEGFARTVSGILRPLLKITGRSRESLDDAILWRLRRHFQFPQPQTFANRWTMPFVLETLRLLQEHRYSSILVTSPPHSMVIVAWLLSILSSVPVMLDFRDPWLDEGGYSYTGARHWLAKWLEGDAIRRARWTVCVSPVQADLLRARYPESAGKIALITNGFDPEDLQQLPPTATDGRFIVSLMGATYSDPQPLWDAIRHNLRQCPDFSRSFVFRWIGAPDDLPVPDLQQSRNLELIPRCSHRQALELVAESSALWLEVPFSERAGYIVRGKTFEYLALRKPILGTAPDGCASRLIVEEACDAKLISSRQVDGMADLLLSAFRTWQNGGLRCPSRTDSLWRFRRDVLTGKLATLLDGSLPRASRV